jgi:hypothetical protein
MFSSKPIPRNMFKAINVILQQVNLKGLKLSYESEDYDLHVDEGQMVSSFWLNSEQIMAVLAASIILMYSLS